MNTAHRPGSPDDDAIEREAHAWARVLGAGSPTVQDGEAFKAWRGQSPAHQRAWAQASRAWRELGGVVQPMRPSVPPRRARTAGRRRHSRPGGAGCWPAAPAPSPAWRPWAAATAAGPVAVLCRNAGGLPDRHRRQRRYALDSQQLTLALNTQTSLNVATRDGRPEIELVAGEAAIQAAATSLAW